MAGRAQPSVSDKIIWDVLDEHLAEAAWEAEQFESALDGPDFTLAELENGPEQRLLIQVDALVVAGRPAVDRLLLPALEYERTRTSRAEAVVVALLLQGEREAALFGLGQLRPEALPGALRAIADAGDETLERLVLEKLGEAPEEQAHLLEIVGVRGLRGPSVANALQSSDPNELVAALHAATWARKTEHRDLVGALLKSPNPSVRDAAMLTGLHYASADAWALCQRLALDGEAPHPFALCLAGGLGSRADEEALVDKLESDAHRCWAIRVLGFGGRPEVIPRLFEYLGDVDSLEAKLAAEAIATIGGLESTEYETTARQHPSLRIPILKSLRSNKTSIQA